jgi:uncharacterized membrane protein (UPF0127 family)
MADPVADPRSTSTRLGAWPDPAAGADPPAAGGPRTVDGDQGGVQSGLGTRLIARNLTRGTVLATDVESGEGMWAKFMGLMGRRSLAPAAGLWLPDSNGIHMMFMRFPIDAVFVGRAEAEAGGARVVRSVHPGLAVWRGLVPLVRGAHGVLELPVGTIASTGTAPGDRIVLERVSD